ncbi:MAG: hypothetical protein PVS2B2_16710 [Candidatus Acidiferrum sp.]
MFFAALLLFCPCTQIDDAPKPQADVTVIVARATPEPSLVASELSSTPDPKVASDAILAAEPIVPRSTPLPLPAGKGLLFRPYETPKEKKIWYALGFAGHSAAAFDAWTTRRAISSGYGTEANPLLRPFANSNAIYAATQLTPLLMDYLAQRMMFSRRNWVRRMWWVPQAAGASISLGAGIHNVGTIR